MGTQCPGDPRQDFIPSTHRPCLGNSPVIAVSELLPTPDLTVPLDHPSGKAEMVHGPISQTEKLRLREGGGDKLKSIGQRWSQDLNLALWL